MRFLLSFHVAACMPLLFEVRRQVVVLASTALCGRPLLPAHRDLGPHWAGCIREAVLYVLGRWREARGQLAVRFFVGEKGQSLSPPHGERDTFWDV